MPSCVGLDLWPHPWLRRANLFILGDKKGQTKIPPECKGFKVWTRRSFMLIYSSVCCLSDRISHSFVYSYTFTVGPLFEINCSNYRVLQIVHFPPHIFAFNSYWTSDLSVFCKQPRQSYRVEVETYDHHLYNQGQRFGSYVHEILWSNLLKLNLKSCIYAIDCHLGLCLCPIYTVNV